MLCRCFCGFSCALLMSLKVLMLLVDKTSLELVFLKQKKKRISKKKSCLLKKIISCERKKKLFQNKFCVGLRSIDVTFFYCGLLDVFVFSKMWFVFVFSFKEKKWKLYSAKFQRYFLPRAPVCFLWEVIW